LSKQQAKPRKTAEESDNDFQVRDEKASAKFHKKLFNFINCIYLLKMDKHNCRD
jgi:hypothetical protein